MARRAAQIGDADSISDFFKQMPPMTKFFLTGTFVSAVAVQFGLIPVFLGGGGAGALVFDWDMLAKKFHIWRLVTPFIFAGTFSINFVIHLFVLYENPTNTELNL